MELIDVLLRGSDSRMLKLGALIIVAALLAASPLYAAQSVSQRPIPIAVPPSSAEQGPSGKQNEASGNDQGTSQRPLVVETHSAPQSEAEAEKDATYQQQRTAGEDARRLSVTTLIVGVLQTLALFATVFMTAYVAVRQLRAYVYPGAAIVRRFNFTKSVVIALDIRNAGQTPARDFECHGSVFITVLPLADDVGMPPPIENPLTGRHSKAAVYPNIPTNIEFDGPDFLTPEIIAELLKPSPEKAIYFAGQAHYRDIFGIKRTSQFCRYIDSEDVVALITLVQKGEEAKIPEVRFVTTHVLNDFT